MRRLQSPRPVGVRRLLTTFLRVVWPSIVLGVVTRFLLVVLTAIFVGGVGEAFVPELASRVIWAVVVCSGVGMGTAFAKRRTVAMGIGGFLGAPLAFDLSRAARKGMVELIRFAPAAGTPSPIALAMVKAAEYACLGIVLELIGRGKASAAHYALVGLATSIVFGGAILLLDALATSAPLPTSAVLGWLVNEFLFPIGCSLVIFTAEQHERRDAQ